jgi:hypothetical protein
MEGLQNYFSYVYIHQLVTIHPCLVFEQQYLCTAKTLHTYSLMGFESTIFCSGGGRNGHYLYHAARATSVKETYLRAMYTSYEFEVHLPTYFKTDTWDHVHKT